MTPHTCCTCTRFKPIPGVSHGHCCSEPPRDWGRPTVHVADPACRWHTPFPVARRPRKCDHCRMEAMYAADETTCWTCHKPLAFKVGP